MYAAWTASRRGHQVILCEAEKEAPDANVRHRPLCPGHRRRAKVSTITNAVYRGCHAALDI